MEMMKVFTIDFDIEKMAIKNGVVEFKKNADDSNLKDYYNIIGCSSIDIVELNEDIAVVVDDEGLLKSGSPVFEITTNDGHELHLAGKLIFAKNHYTDDGVELMGLDSGEILSLMVDLKLSVIGVTQ